jgi:hypothetical protein
MIDALNFGDGLRLVSKKQDEDAKYTVAQKSSSNKQKKSKKFTGKAMPLELVFGAPDKPPDVDILEGYYQSKLPPPEHYHVYEDDFPALDERRKNTIQLHADQITRLAFANLTSGAATPHLLIETDALKSLNAGGSPEIAFRDKLERIGGPLSALKAFPRLNCVAASFQTARQCALAHISLNKQKMCTSVMTCKHLLKFPTREVILASYKPLIKETLAPTPACAAAHVPAYHAAKPAAETPEPISAPPPAQAPAPSPTLTSLDSFDLDAQHDYDQDAMDYLADLLEGDDLI